MKKKTPPDQIIYKYLIDNGVLPFWTQSAIDQIRQVLNSNSHFVYAISNPSLRVKDGHVASFACDAKVSIPNPTWETPATSSARITYSFTPSRTKSHKVKIYFG